MSDVPSTPDGMSGAPPAGQLPEPMATLPPLEQDRSVLAWLHGSQQLSAAATGYLCDALLEWALAGLPWPEEAAPAASLQRDHLQTLVLIAERLQQRIALTRPASSTLVLGRVGRHLSHAIRCQLDPQGLQASLDREQLHQLPWLASRPSPVGLGDGLVL